MSIVTWIKELFGTRWSDKEVVQYVGDTMDHGIDETPEHIRQLRNRRPSLHQRQRLLVDAKIRELEANLKSRYDRDVETKRVKEEAKRTATINLAESQRRANESHNVKPRETYKSPKCDVDDDNVGWTPPAQSYSAPAPSSSYHGGHSSSHSSSHSPSYSHSHSSSCSHSHSSSDSGSSYSSSDSGSSSSSCD